jgi:hypothetical protein
MKALKKILITKIDNVNNRFAIILDGKIQSVLNHYKAQINKDDLILLDELTGEVNRYHCSNVSVRENNTESYQTFSNSLELDAYLFEIGFYPGKCCGGDNSGGENEYQEPFKELLIYFNVGEYNEETETFEINHTIVRNTFDLPISIDTENLFFIINENLPINKTVGFYISKRNNVPVEARTGTRADNNRFEITTDDQQYFFHIKKYL